MAEANNRHYSWGNRFCKASTIRGTEVTKETHRSQPQPLSGGVYAWLAFASLAATCLVGYGMYYAGTQLVSQPIIRSFYYVLLWVLGITSALFLFGVLRSAASISGRRWGTVIDLGGPAALAVLVVGGGYKFAELPDAFSLTVRLQGDRPITEMTSGAWVWVDLSGRREHKPFGNYNLDKASNGLYI